MARAANSGHRKRKSSFAATDWMFPSSTEETIPPNLTLQAQSESAADCVSFSSVAGCDIPSFAKHAKEEKNVKSSYKFA